MRKRLEAERDRLAEAVFNQMLERDEMRLETKGLHLKNPNTDYKKSVFGLCNQHAKKRAWSQLVPAMRDKEIRYEVVFEDEWKKRLNELLAE